jgi:hypothetical protein
LAFLNLLQIAVVSRKNIAFGIPDRVMVLFGSALVDGINQFKFVTASHFSFFRLVTNFDSFSDFSLCKKTAGLCLS